MPADFLGVFSTRRGVARTFTLSAEGMGSSEGAAAIFLVPGGPLKTQLGRAPGTPGSQTSHTAPCALPGFRERVPGPHPAATRRRTYVFSCKQESSGEKPSTLSLCCGHSEDSENAKNTVVQFVEVWFCKISTRSNYRCGQRWGFLEFRKAASDLRRPGSAH